MFFLSSSWVLKKKKFPSYLLKKSTAKWFIIQQILEYSVFLYKYSLSFIPQACRWWLLIYSHLHWQEGQCEARQARVSLTQFRSQPLHTAVVQQRLILLEGIPSEVVRTTKRDMKPSVPHQKWHFNSQVLFPMFLHCGINHRGSGCHVTQTCESALINKEDNLPFLICKLLDDT